MDAMQVREPFAGQKNMLAVFICCEN
jgi:hypothetical protein